MPPTVHMEIGDVSMKKRTEMLTTDPDCTPLRVETKQTALEIQKFWENGKPIYTVTLFSTAPVRRD